MPENTTHRDTIAALRDAIGYVMRDTTNALSGLRPDEYSRRDTWSALLDAHRALGNALYATARSSDGSEVFENLHRADEALDHALADVRHAEARSLAGKLLPYNTTTNVLLASRELDSIMQRWPDLYGPAFAAVSVSA